MNAPRTSSALDRLRDPGARRALLRGGLAGMAGGALAFLILQPLRGGGAGNVFDGFDSAFLPGIIFGALVTAALVLGEELSSGSSRRMLRRATGGLMLGAVLGAGYSVLGYTIYEFFQALLGWGGNATRLIARAAGWSLFGLGAGLSAGILSHSGRRSYHGCIGGVIGGFVGGLLFEVIPYLETLGPLRLLFGLAIVGGAVGIATALVEHAAKGAWLTFLSGSREGRQVVLHRESAVLGRDELVDIPLFGDVQVERRHAVVSLAPTPAVQELSAAPLMRVNGHPVRGASLSDGDVVEIGSHRFRFHYVAWHFSTGTAAPPIAVALDKLLTDDPLPPLRAVPTAAPAAAPAGFTPAPPVQGIADLVLRVIAGPHAGVAFPLTGPVTLGRERVNTLPLADSRVSRYHARIEHQGGAWVLTDLNSTNGTLLNGSPVVCAGLTPGDQICLGDTVIVVEPGVPGAAIPPYGALRS